MLLSKRHVEIYFTCFTRAIQFFFRQAHATHAEETNFYLRFVAVLWLSTKFNGSLQHLVARQSLRCTCHEVHWLLFTNYDNATHKPKMISQTMIELEWEGLIDLGLYVAECWK